MATGRRAVGPLAAIALTLCLLASAAVAQQAPDASGPSAHPPAVLVVNRERMVSQSEAARSLRRIEIELRDRVQGQLDKVREALEAEEQELTRLREELPKEEFDARARDFDRRVRIERRAAQERGASLQKFIAEAQEALLRAADPVLEELRREKGAVLLLDAGAAVAYDPDIDITDEAITRFDEAVSEVTFTPPPDLAGE